MEKCKSKVIKCFAIRLTFLIFGLFLYSLQTHAAEISGIVKDIETNHPLPGANVILENTKLGIATDRDGRFQLSDIPPGNYKLTVSFIGYEKEESEFSIVNEDDSLFFEVNLHIPGIKLTCDSSSQNYSS